MSTATVNTDVLIEDGETVQTGSIDLQSYLLSGISIPTGFEGTTITFQASVDGSTFHAVLNSDGTALTVTCAASRHIVLEPQTFAGAAHLKLVAGTAQTGDITLTVVLHRAR